MSKLFMVSAIYLAVALTSGCANHPTLDSDVRALVTERDKYIRSNMGIWRSEISDTHKGGLVVLDPKAIGTEYSSPVVFQGDSIHEVRQEIVPSMGSALCIWVWRSPIALSPNIHGCGELIAISEIETTLREDLLGLREDHSELVSKVGAANVRAAELETKVEKLRLFVEVVEENQGHIRDIATASTDFTKLVLALLQDIEKLASEQSEELRSILDAN